MIKHNETDDEGNGGKSGKIELRYKQSLATLRDDLLPPSEIKRLLVVHHELHKSRVDKQKQLRKERAMAKEKNVDYRTGVTLGGAGGGTVSQYKKHPISQKAQFSGIDRQVTALPSENIAETNQEQRAELENQYVLRHRAAPKFHPKPRPM